MEPLFDPAVTAKLRKATDMFQLGVCISMLLTGFLSIIGAIIAVVALSVFAVRKNLTVGNTWILGSSTITTAVLLVWRLTPIWPLFGPVGIGVVALLLAALFLLPIAFHAFTRE
jgi:hypothetical protein